MTNFPRPGGFVKDLQNLEQRIYALEKKLAGESFQRSEEFSQQSETMSRQAATISEQSTTISKQSVMLKKLMDPPANPEGIGLNLTGPWATAAPKANDGTLFKSQGGMFRGIAAASGSAAVLASLISIGVYVDGVLQGTTKVNAAVALSQLTTVPCSLSFELSAGSHYVYFRLLSGASNNLSYGTFFGVVSNG